MCCFTRRLQRQNSAEGEGVQKQSGHKGELCCAHAYCDIQSKRMQGLGRLRDVTCVETCRADSKVGAAATKLTQSEIREAQAPQQVWYWASRSMYHNECTELIQ